MCHSDRAWNDRNATLSSPTAPQVDPPYTPGRPEQYPLFSRLREEREKKYSGHSSKKMHLHTSAYTFYSFGAVPTVEACSRIERVHVAHNALGWESQGWGQGYDWG